MSFESRIISVVVVVGFVGSLAVVLLHYDVSLRDVAILLTGVLSSKFGTVVDYFLGSSAGSAAKTEIMKEKGEKCTS